MRVTGPLFHVNVLRASFDLIAGEISAKEEKFRSEDLQVADYNEKTEKFINPAFL
jgi:hypothetical protein